MKTLGWVVFNADADVFPWPLDIPDQNSRRRALIALETVLGRGRAEQIYVKGPLYRIRGVRYRHGQPAKLVLRAQTSPR